MKRIIGLALAALAFTTAPAVVAVVAAPSAEARTQAQAQGDLVYFSAVDCPHHSSGKCLKRDGWITAGLGGGRWSAIDRGWECYAWEPCAFGSYVHARFFYTRSFWIENDGSRSHVSGFSDDG